MTTSASYLWKPSNARYVQINGFVQVPRGPQVPPPQPLVWPPKDPGDTLDYVFDIQPALTANPGDGISSMNVTISPNEPGDLTLLSSAIDGTKVVLWLSGGQAQTSYTVTVYAVTNGGRTVVRSIALPVVSLSSALASADALQTSTGQPLTDPTGTPLTTI